MIRSGNLRHRIQLQEPTETRDAHGQAVKTWKTKANVWASVEPLRGAESIIQHQYAATQIEEVAIRHRSDVTTDWRILHDGRTLEIESKTNPYGRIKNGLVMRCRETK